MFQMYQLTFIDGANINRTIILADVSNSTVLDQNRGFIFADRMYF